MTASKPKTLDQGPFKAWHFWTIMAVMFGIVMLVNGIFVFYALSSWTGVVEDKAYERGLAYNEAIDRAERQKALGWTSTLEMDTLDGQDRINVTLVNADGAPLLGADVEVVLRRPTQADLDRAVTLNAGDPGLYQALLDVPARGLWELRIHVRQGEDSLEIRERTILK